MKYFLNVFKWYSSINILKTDKMSLICKTIKCTYLLSISAQFSSLAQILNTKFFFFLSSGSQGPERDLVDHHPQTHPGQVPHPSPPVWRTGRLDLQQLFQRGLLHPGGGAEQTGGAAHTGPETRREVEGDPGHDGPGEGEGGGGPHWHAQLGLEGRACSAALA